MVFQGLKVPRDQLALKEHRVHLVLKARQVLRELVALQG